MKRFRSLMLMMAVGMLVAAPLNAQGERWIQFPKGKSSTVVKGSTGTSGVAYVLRARSGQKIVLDLTPANGVGVKVETHRRYGQMVLPPHRSGRQSEVRLAATRD